ncbi:MAG: ATP-binding protein [Haloplanus sp.]
MSDYLDAFVTESREQIRQLNNSLLDLEADPDDEEALDDIFRTAHTLKGNFGAMGFEEPSDLAHAVEDLLDAIREGEVEVTPEVMDHVFAGVDLLEAAVDGVDEDGEANIDAEDTIHRLRAAMDDTDGTAAPDETTEMETDAAATDEGTHVRATVSLDDPEMPGVDAMLVLDAAASDLDLVGSDPDREAIQSGAFDGSFDLLVDAPDPDAVAGSLEEHGPVADVSATLVDSEAESDASDEAADESEPAQGDEEQAARDGDDDIPDDETADDEPDERDDGADDGAKDGGATVETDDIDTVRVDVEQLDTLHGLVEQLVTGRIKLQRNLENDDVEAALEDLGELDKVSSHLQDTVMEMRLVPLETVVGQFPRLVRDLAREQQKQIDFEMHGEDVELDRTILTEISDPLMHVLRNAVDHGIESPDERAAAGKPETGHVELRATRQRDHVVIEVEDDGAGIHADEIREKAVEEGVRSREEVEALDDDEVYDLVFAAGFSTAEEVTDVSGRGVGMDVVKQTVNRLDGTLDVDSDPGEGTRVRIRLPVSVAIVQVLFVSVGDATFGVPIKNVDEITHTDAIETVNGEQVVEHDEDIYPVVDLTEALDGIEGAAAATDGGRQRSKLVRIRPSVRPVAFRCDGVETQEEVVVKPLDGLLSGTEGIGGTAVLGDGNVIPILDVATLGSDD